jgi:hypothetical protein
MLRSAEILSLKHEGVQSFLSWEDFPQRRKGAKKTQDKSLMNCPVTRWLSFRFKRCFATLRLCGKIFGCVSVALRLCGFIAGLNYSLCGLENFQKPT